MVELRQDCGSNEGDGWSGTALETGQQDVILRQHFPAPRGTCPELTAELIQIPPGGFLLRISGEVGPPDLGVDPGVDPEDDAREEGWGQTRYTAVLHGLPAGTHRLRVVHVWTGMPVGQGASGPPRVTAVLDHPVLVVPDAP